MPNDKTEKRLIWSAAGTAGCSSLIYGLSAWLDQSSKHLREIRSVKDLKELHNVLNGAKPEQRVAVTGAAWTDEPIIKTLNNQKAAAIRVDNVEILSTRTENGIRPGERFLSISRRAAPLYLKWGESRLHVLPRDLKDLDPILEHTGTLQRPAKFDAIRSILEGYANKTFVVRQEEREHCLPMGAEITAIGQIQEHGKDYALAPQHGHMHFSKLDIEQQMQQMDRWSSGFRSTALFFAGLSVLFVGSLVTYKLVKVWQRQKKRRKEQMFLRAAEAARKARQARQPLPAAAVEAPGEQRSWHCLVCWNEGEGVQQAVFPACGHVSVCEECAANLSQCPVCRTRSTPRRLYFS